MVCIAQSSDVDVMAVDMLTNESACSGYRCSDGNAMCIVVIVVVIDALINDELECCALPDHFSQLSHERYSSCQLYSSSPVGFLAMNHAASFLLKFQVRRRLAT